MEEKIAAKKLKKQAAKAQVIKEVTPDEKPVNENPETDKECDIKNDKKKSFEPCGEGLDASPC